MQIPPYLQTGDTIAIVSTARKITRTEIDIAIRAIEKQGFKVKIGKTIGLENNQMAGTDKEKILDFNDQIYDPKVKAILCARGGYGSVRIVDHLDFDHLKKYPKWIIGYSDVTTIHQALFSQEICTSLHATMPINFSDSEEAKLNIDSMFNALKGEKLIQSFAPHPLNRLGKSSGKVIGGNLSILYSLCGSRSNHMNFSGKILFLEDLDEYLYHVDRMMMNLKRNGILDNLSGLIIGGMSDMNDNSIPFGKNADEIIYEHVEDYTYPVAFNFPAGHTEKNRALKMGCPLDLKVTKDQSTSIQS